MDDYSILVVDDNPDDQVLTVRALKNASKNSPVIVLEDGQEALDFLFGDEKTASRRNLDTLGVILLDVKLPRVNGLEVLKHIRSSPLTNWMPVIMISSSDEPSELVEAYRLGANSYITKAIDYHEFTEQMTLLARYWLTVNKVPESGSVRKL
ncbi:response regulator [Marinobacter sp. ANT_B65]|uniref:response regulator n=1 Tax=Marinobacter sp. ANT_B65 TaxID=2039467 RepID=UPI000BBE10A2|nr:response regulator [Marinobacter sp. ANT_B65]PCM45872.1 two-component system response regulator [Marinobacter sp. ANT_B65]